MLEYSLPTAKSDVRARLDEMASDSSDMLASSLDDRNLESIIENLLPEAIEAVHLIAPYELLEGVTITNTNATCPESSMSNGVISIAVRGTDILPCLRLISFHCYIDSDVVLTEAHPENSQIARLQLNKYMRGTPENPVLVRADSVEIGSSRYYSEDGHPSFRYYTCVPPTGESYEFNLTYFPKPELHTISGTSPSVSGYSISGHLKTNVADYLTALVLNAYKNEYAKVFFDKAMEGIK